MKRPGISIVSLLFLCAFAVPARAHQIKISPLEIEIRDTEIHFASDLVPLEVLGETEIVLNRVAEGKGLTDLERGIIYAYFDNHLQFSEDEVRLSFIGRSAGLARRESDALDHIVVEGYFARPREAGAIVLEAKNLFAEEIFGAYPPLPVGHVRGRDYLQIHSFDGFEPFIPPASRGWLQSVRRVLAWTYEGIWHIFTGYDHVLFLLGLHLVSPSLRETLKIVSAFTVSHTLTLTLAATGVVTIAPAIVEPAIALTIVYVGIENLIFTLPAGRWKTALLFGFIHGFGFAGSLGQSLQLDQLGRADFAIALFCFNLGVEIGQACVVTALAPFWVGVRWIPKRTFIVNAGSIAISCAGLYWFFQRI